MKTLKSKLWTTKLSKLKLLLLLFAFIPTSLVYATNSNFSAWQNIYPNSTSGDSASCQLCHAASTQNLNTYGRDLCVSGAGNINNRILDVESINSDSDPTGSNNVKEINANTQPGWTPGNVNPTYSRNNCQATGVVESPPSFIPGDMDPAATNQPPVANAGGPYSGTVNVAMTFDGSASTDSDGTIVSYSWSFGDGNTATGVSPTHTYTTAGTFTVTLTVTDDVGDTGTNSTTATIGQGNQPPVANAGGPYSGTVNVALTFNGSASTDPDGTIVSYSWDFGDGNTGTGATPSHTYTTANTYNVTLTVTDNMSATDSAGTTATIGQGNQSPVANAGGPYTGTAGVALTFDGSGSSDPDGTIVSYSWDFGDGNTGTGVSPSHTYGANGNYTVSLTVTDNQSATGTATTTATIGAVNKPPVANPGGPYSGTINTALSFDGSGSTDSDGTIVSYSWDFGDGNTGTGVSPSHTYTAAGTFTVSLKVTDNAGDTGTATTTAVIGLGNKPPVANPNGPYSGTVGVAVAFDGTGSSDPDGTIVSYSWNFGDGNTGSGASPSHTYTAQGTYNVTLTVTDNANATDSAMTTAKIVPVATGKADVFLIKMKAPKDKDIETGESKSEDIKVKGDGDTIEQDAKVSLSVTSPVGLTVKVYPQAITKTVSPFDDDATKYKFKAKITCHVAGDYELVWNATISAAENNNTSNDTLTGSTQVSCKTSDDDDDDEHHDDEHHEDKDDDHHNNMKKG